MLLPNKVERKVKVTTRQAQQISLCCLLWMSSYLLSTNAFSRRRHLKLNWVSISVLEKTMKDSKTHVMLLKRYISEESFVQNLFNEKGTSARTWGIKYHTTNRNRLASKCEHSIFSQAQKKLGLKSMQTRKDKDLRFAGEVTFCLLKVLRALQSTCEFYCISLIGYISDYCIYGNIYTRIN